MKPCKFSLSTGLTRVHDEKRRSIVDVTKTLIFSLALTGLFAGSAEVSASTDSNCANPDPTVNPYGGTWICPDEAAIPNTPEGDMIRYGKELLTKTYKYMTQLGVVPSYSIGNQLSCTNCHLKEGRAAWSGSWAVVYYKYGGGDARVAPTKGSYSARINAYLTPTGRIQDCLQRSMNAQTNVLSETSYEMQSMVSYFKWLSTGVRWADMGGPVTDWKQVKAQGFVSLPLLTRPADPVRGKVVYEDNCAACHGSDGEGLWNPKTQTYIFPAVWGPRSFNDGAGMYRMLTGPRFIKGNMPFSHANATEPATQLSDGDTYDVSAYVFYQSRPVWWNQGNDWRCGAVSPVASDLGMPDWMRKPPDAGYGPYYPRWDGSHYTCDATFPQIYTEAQHMYGPWQDMLTLQTKIQADFKLCGHSPCP